MNASLVRSYPPPLAMVALITSIPSLPPLFARHAPPWQIGPIDILVNNAGIVSGKKLLECPDALIEKTFQVRGAVAGTTLAAATATLVYLYSHFGSSLRLDPLPPCPLQVNAISHFWTLKAVLPGMMERNHGHIVTIASSAGKVRPRVYMKAGDCFSAIDISVIAAPFVPPALFIPLSFSLPLTPRLASPALSTTAPPSTLPSARTRASAWSSTKRVGPWPGHWTRASRPKKSNLGSCHTPSSSGKTGVFTTVVCPFFIDTGMFDGAATK